jgi:hypothetical protein
MRENKHSRVWKQIGNHLCLNTNPWVHMNLTILIGRCWMLILFSVSLIKVEILWLHIKLICKLERIGGSILYVQKWNKHWIPFIYDLLMLWSPVQNFESALGITHAPTRSLSVSSRGLSLSLSLSLAHTHTHTYHLSSSLCLSNLIDLPRYRDCISLIVRSLFDTCLGHSTMH